MKKGSMLRVACFGLLLTVAAQAVSADEVGELKKQMAQMMDRLAQLEARQKLRERSLKQRIEEVAEKKAAEPQSTGLPDSLKWAEKVKLSGDFRYRHEHIDEEKAGSVRWKDGRSRHRIRARLMITSVVNDEWGVGFRIASGSDDPASTNQTLDDHFSSKELWLDLAYFDYHPTNIDGLNVYGGKIKNPFYRVGKNQLVWDGDVNPEGIAAQYALPLGDADTLHINGGGFWVEESSGGVDTALWGAQTYIEHEIGNPDTIIAGVSYWDYVHVKGQPVLTQSLGNTVVSGAYANDYDILELFGEYKTKFSAMPVSFFGNWVKNTAASTSEDKGWLVGTTLNKAKNPGEWQASYMYRDLEADAVLGTFSDSDFIGGGTDGKGHTFGFAYQLAKNTQAALTYFHNEDHANSSNRDFDYRRLQADLKLKF